MKTNRSRMRTIASVVFVLLAFTVTPALAMNETLVGAVVKTDAGAALSTDGGEYLFLGKDPTGQIGKTVAVTGNVENGVLSQTVRVKTVKVISNKDLIDPQRTLATR